MAKQAKNQAKKAPIRLEALTVPEYMIPIQFVFPKGKPNVILHMRSVPRVGEKITFEKGGDPYVVCEVGYGVSETGAFGETTVRVR